MHQIAVFAVIVRAVACQSGGRRKIKRLYRQQLGGQQAAVQLGHVVLVAVGGQQRQAQLIALIPFVPAQARFFQQFAAQRQKLHIAAAVGQAAVDHHHLQALLAIAQGQGGVCFIVERGVQKAKLDALVFAFDQIVYIHGPVLGKSQDGHQQRQNQRKAGQAAHFTSEFQH